MDERNELAAKQFDDVVLHFRFGWRLYLTFFTTLMAANLLGMVLVASGERPWHGAVSSLGFIFFLLNLACFVASAKMSVFSRESATLRGELRKTLSESEDIDSFTKLAVLGIRAATLSSIVLIVLTLGWIVLIFSSGDGPR